MSKEIEENDLTVTIKRIYWEFHLYWKFMSTNKSNGKNKTNLIPPSSTPVTVFLTVEKLSRL